MPKMVAQAPTFGQSSNSLANSSTASDTSTGNTAADTNYVSTRPTFTFTAPASTAITFGSSCAILAAGAANPAPTVFQAKPPSTYKPPARRPRRRQRYQNRKSKLVPANATTTIVTDVDDLLDGPQTDDRTPRAKRVHRAPIRQEKDTSINSLGLWSKDIHHYFAKHRAIRQILLWADLTFDDLLAELRLVPDMSSVRVTRNADKKGFLGEPLAQDSIPQWLSTLVEQLAAVADCNSKWRPLTLKAPKGSNTMTVATEAEGRQLVRRFFDRLPSPAIPTEACLILRKVAQLLTVHPQQDRQKRLMTVAVTALPQASKALLAMFIRNPSACADTRLKTRAPITEQALWLASTMCQLLPTRRNKVMHELVGSALSQILLNPNSLTWSIEEGIDDELRTALKRGDWAEQWPLVAPDPSLSPAHHMFLRKLCGHQGLQDTVC
eukprot:TRINITY_DN5224_c0_g2_i2.p1 TRINITY_DN5224_c0_g2~~TRINITY_DN5224_c0_g2_i2.p1  ORF type:complete len:508 (+),score=123.45 TRINITY_DN5224_c0_g2_i2:212-1525(+)